MKDKIRSPLKRSYLAPPGRCRLALFALLAFLLVSTCLTACTTRQVHVAANSGAGGSENSININTATADELESIPRIGPKTAENIVRFRTENGPFRRVEHLMQIRGISERRFLAIRPYLRIE